VISLESGVADEILVAPDRGDRSRGPAVPIWVVWVGDELYVRSFRGASGGWYRRARFSRNSNRVGMSFGSDSVK
jgi:hypothetical protein